MSCGQQIELAWEALATNDHDVVMDPTGSIGAGYEKSMSLSGLLGTKGMNLWAPMAPGSLA
tara:strand:+ start:1392 stop:1574 length:183 start_codon:yes stop_codon:yes gene_type:complete